MHDSAHALPRSAVPKTQEDAFYWLKLIRSARVGPITFLRLLRQFGTAKDAVEALPDIANGAGVSKYETVGTPAIRQEIRAGNALGARLLFLGTKDYPTQLLDLPDPPIALWCLGNLELLKRPMIALVGARNASATGQRMSGQLARDLGEMGYVVISGLARGIDKAAHEKSLATGTIAVQAGGLDTIYPKENADLTLKIAEQGLRLSEMPMGLSPRARHFPKRNRIISGLSSAVIVVEGATRSGSLITARNALDQGREVMAIPGSPLDPRASGCNQLIRDGALLVRGADDIHDFLQAHPQHSNPQNETPEQHRQQDIPLSPHQTNLPSSILDLLSISPISEDDLIRKLDAPTLQIMGILAELDVEGEIHRQPGGLIAKTNA